jgi:hypothetical protein
MEGSAPAKDDRSGPAAESHYRNNNNYGNTINISSYLEDGYHWRHGNYRAVFGQTPASLSRKLFFIRNRVPQETLKITGLAASLP